MKVITAEPLDTMQMIMMSPTHDALLQLGEFKCRYIRASVGQETEVPYTYYDSDTGLAFGLRPVKGKGYDYMAIRIE